MRQIEFGVANVAPCPMKRPGAYVLWIDGVAQSYVDLIDPTYIEFPYMRRIANVFDTVAPAGRPLDVLHLGGGAYTMPRYLAATRPGSAQVVVERDAKLAALVDELLPLPDGSNIEIRIDDARGVVESTPPGSFDIVVADAYEAGVIAGNTATTEFVAAAYEVLAPGGTYVVNVTDMPPLAFSRRQVATVREVFPDVCLLTELSLLRGKRHGNTVIAGRKPPRTLPVTRLTRLVRTTDGAISHAERLDEFALGAKPLVDGEAT